MEIVKLADKLAQRLEKLGGWVTRGIDRISKTVRSNARLRNANSMTDLIVGITSIAALIVLIIAILSPCLANSNMYFWVYSTIIQAFAAMITLVAIFLIYRLEMLKREEQPILQRLKENLVSTILSQQSLQASQTTQEIAPESGKKNRRREEERRLERLQESEIIQEATLEVDELTNRIGEGKLNEGDRVSVEYIRDRLDKDAQEMKCRKRLRDSLLSSIRSPLILVGTIIGISVILLPFSSGATNPYASIPLSFLLTLVLGLSIIALLKIIRSIMIIVGIEDKR